MIFDFDTPLEDRLECAVHADDLGDIISRLAFMYVVSSCRDIGEFLLAIATHTEVNYQLRFEAAKSVVEHHNTFVNFVNNGYAAVDILCREPHELLFRQSVIVYLMGSNKYKFHARKYLVTLIDDSAIELKHRYGCVVGLERASLSEKNRQYFMAEGFVHIIYGTGMSYMYKIMAAQRILSMFLDRTDLGPKTLRHLENAQLFLVDTCMSHPEYNLRADAADVLINCGEPHLADIGRTVIDQLGGGANYFSNEQNVHIKSIEQSCEDNLARLITCVGIVKPLDVALDEFDKTVQNSKCKEAFDRIVADRAVYTRFKLTLGSIFALVWTYISRQNNDEMVNRLAEDLADAVGLCSSGFMARMVNALSGFDGFLVGISFEDQVAAYFTTTVNTMLQSFPDCEDVLDDMASGGGPALNVFLRNNLSKIRETLFAEFVGSGSITDTDFDLYFKRAYARYYD